MINISEELMTLSIVAAILIGLFSGFPVPLVIGGVTLIFGWITFGPQIIDIIYMRGCDGFLYNYIFLALPLFCFMGIMLEHSGIAEKLFDALYMFLGQFRGGLAIVTILMGTIIAATVGIITASVAMLTLVALPAMVSRGYSKSVASGAVCAGGCLGILIPPSMMLVVYGPLAQISVGKLFFGAFGPGLLLSLLYCVYIGTRGYFQPNVAPAVPKEHMAGVPFSRRLTMLLTSLVPPLILIMSVLGVIFLGIAAPTEAAGCGAFAATVLVIAYRKFNLRILKEVCVETGKISGMMSLIAIAAVGLVAVFMGSGGGRVAEELILSVPGGKWGAFLMIMFMVFILGFFAEWLVIVFVMVPIITPIVAALGFDPLWFAIMVCLIMQTCFMTPPVAGAIFVLKGLAPPEMNLTMNDIIIGVTPFIIMVLLTVGLCIAFPPVITWLPSKMIH